MNLIEWPYYRKEFLKSQGLSETFVQRFWSKVQITDGCWIWTASKDEHGYGQIGRWKEGQRPIRAHVASWIIHFGPIPEGLWILHGCDNPPCARPDHLSLGTPAKNTADMMNRGRHVIGVRHRGEKNHNSKLSRAEVEKIRSLYESGQFTQEALGALFGVCPSNISAVIRHAIWR